MKETIDLELLGSIGNSSERYKNNVVVTTSGQITGDNSRSKIVKWIVVPKVIFVSLRIVVISVY